MIIVGKIEKRLYELWIEARIWLVFSINYSNICSNFARACISDSHCCIVTLTLLFTGILE